MATAPNSTLDTILEVISGCTVVHACTSEPADFAGIAAVSVGNYALTAGDYTIADAASGRQVTLAAQTGEDGTATGPANFLAYADATTLHYVTAASGETINTGSPWTIAPYVIANVLDPVDV